jgi:transglutaminase-like putative cysteine protease
MFGLRLEKVRRFRICAVIGWWVLLYSLCLAFPADCLYDSVFIDIKSNYTAEITYKTSFHFSEPRTEKYSIIRVPVNSHIEFEFIEVSTRLPDGREIELDKDDIETVSDFTPQYYPDSKSKIIYIPLPRSGAVSRVAYKLKYESLLYLPRFFRQRDIATANSYLQVKSSIPYSYYAGHDFIFEVVEDSTAVFINDAIPPMIKEPNGPPDENYQIVITPDSLVYMGHKYGFATWTDVAHFYNDLSAATDDGQISSQVIELAHSLTAAASSRDDSLKALLDFVRDNIRYISADIGRGEFKPLGADEVLAKKYGDCKDQSALLTSLCRAIGFAANPALMATRGQPDLIISHPWPGFFNHVITAVDTGNGYLFLDASRPTCCFGNLPFALRNRRALICGDQPFLDFTLTSPFEQGNDIEIDLIYKITRSGDLSADVEINLYKDPAFIFQAKTADQALSNVLTAFFGDDISGRYRSGFKVNIDQHDLVRITGNYFEKLTPSSRSNRLMVNVQSPYLKLLRKYFMPPPRFQPYEFEFGFNVRENVILHLPENYRADKDSVELSFNERGIRADINVLVKNDTCEIVKEFKLFDYSLSGDRYNKFVDYLLIASQIPYNSFELIPSTDTTGENVVGPKPR